MLRKKSELLLLTGKDNLCDTCGRFEKDDYLGLDDHCRQKGTIIFKKRKCKWYYMNCFADDYTDKLDEAIRNKYG